MQSDFPCQIGQSSYEMHIEPEEQRESPIMEALSANFTAPLINFKDVEIPRNKKAMIQLDNNIRLCLDVKHAFTQNNSIQDQLGNPSAQQKLHSTEGITEELNLNNLSVRSQIQYEGDKITSVVTIQLQNQTLNIVNDMFLINQLCNSQIVQCGGKPNEVLLTKHNLSSLPDVSGKRNQIQKQQIRKGSDNSYNSDATQILGQNAGEQGAANNCTYQCVKCGAENTISSLSPIENSNLSSVEQLDLNTSSLKNSNPASAAIREFDVIKNQICQQDPTETTKKISSNNRRVRKSALEQEVINEGERVENSFSLSKKSHQGGLTGLKNNKQTQQPGDNSLSPNLRSSSIQQYGQNKCIEEEEQNITNGQYLMGESNIITQFVQLYEQSEDKEIKIQSKRKKSYQTSDQLISTAHLLQSESYYNCSGQADNQSAIYVVSQQQLNENINLPAQKEYLIDSDTFSKSNGNKPDQQSTYPQITEFISTRDTPILTAKIIHYDNAPTMSCTSLPSSQLERMNIEATQQNSKLSQSQIECEQLKENDTYDEQSQDQSENENQEEYFLNSCDEQDTFTDEVIAKADKKNVVKNFAKAFISYVKKDESILNSVEYPQKDAKLQNFNQRLKKFQNYMKKYKFNNLFIKQLISNSEYSTIFQDFLIKKADEWLTNSNVQDKETHKQMLKFFQRAVFDDNLLCRLKTLKKSKRVPNSNSNNNNNSNRASYQAPSIQLFSSSP